MFVWCGVNVDSQLAEVKCVAREIEQNLHFQHSNFTLPFHVSLKMSFEVSKQTAEAVKNDLAEFFSQICPFEVEVDCIEYSQNICWIRMKECGELNAIHDKLNEFLLCKYGVPLHEYDCDYKFHTTLFMDDDVEKVREAYERVKNCPLPQKLCANVFDIGESPQGKLGTYKVVKEICVC